MDEHTVIGRCNVCGQNLTSNHICGVTKLLQLDSARRTDDEVHKLDGLTPLTDDMLEDIFIYQRSLMEKLGVPALDNKRKDVKIPITEFTKMLTSFSQTCTTALSCEITELLDALPWKPWKKNYKEIDLNNAHIEIVDMLHFVIELAIIWGMTERKLYDLYLKKMQENIDRQKKGY
jgi:hypothetical protein